MFFKSLLAFAVVGFIAPGSVKAQNSTQTGDSLADVLRTNGQTNQLFTQINATNPSIISLLQGGNNTNDTYTVFAPADSAFTAQVIALLPTISDLHDLILYHVVNGTHLSSSFQNGDNIIDSIVNNGSLLKWSNGTGLPLDVVKGGSASSTSDSTSTKTSSGASPTSSTGFSVYYGIGSANVIQTDIKASNGIIHIIDSLLSLPQSPSYTVQQNFAGGQQLSMFYEALNRTGLVSTVDGQNGITIFAPSNTALSGFNFSAYSNDTLTKILKYHIIDQVYYSTNLTAFTNPTNITTAEGDNATITSSNSGSDITVGNYNTTGKVVQANILTDNGVIHIIDTVLFPINVTNGSSSSNSNNGTGNGTSSAAPASYGAGLAIPLSFVAIIASLLL